MITSNAANANLTVPLTGAGVKYATVLSRTSLNFTDVPVGKEATQDVLVTNAGAPNANITISNFNLTGDSCFTLDPASGTSLVLEPHKPGTLRVKFNPTSATTNSV
ncbi:hypothetical protein [Cystobacter fuscus]|uniref:Ig-like domain-containing protein n=1 Tax=Cystobacter fuscus TaxID=43 RepID=UPI0037C016E1